MTIAHKWQSQYAWICYRVGWPVCDSHKHYYMRFQGHSVALRYSVNFLKKHFASFTGKHVPSRFFLEGWKPATILRK